MFIFPFQKKHWPCKWIRRIPLAWLRLFRSCCPPHDRGDPPLFRPTIKRIDETFFFCVSTLRTLAQSTGSNKAPLGFHLARLLQFSGRFVCCLYWRPGCFFRNTPLTLAVATAYCTRHVGLLIVSSLIRRLLSLFLPVHGSKQPASRRPSNRNRNSDPPWTT